MAWPKKEKVKKSIVLVVEKADNFRYQHQLPWNWHSDTASLALSPSSGEWTSGFTQRQAWKTTEPGTLVHPPRQASGSSIRITGRESVTRSVMSVSATLQTVARQAPLSMGILQARILEQVAIPFSRGIFPTQGLNHVSHQGSPESLGRLFQINFLLSLWILQLWDVAQEAVFLFVFPLP